MHIPQGRLDAHAKKRKSRECILFQRFICILNSISQCILVYFKWKIHFPPSKRDHTRSYPMFILRLCTPLKQTKWPYIPGIMNIMVWELMASYKQPTQTSGKLYSKGSTFYRLLSSLLCLISPISLRRSSHGMSQKIWGKFFKL